MFECPYCHQKTKSTTIDPLFIHAMLRGDAACITCAHCRFAFFGRIEAVCMGSVDPAFVGSTPAPYRGAADIPHTQYHP
ncbi:hypothetical protein [Desulfobotulus mexicanus]|uniref:Uncharacterized protein n=1 Tax=Desulfobotulus mexicanus TaxID=2586642 RepID=A0A5Q4VHK3_9BACT|nr:hypothetical protein [Desulfobotulus mexicanus]TYT75660.1 hypothetical protein FIM25_04275 [Desulfobotulus mexicanus]